MGFGVHECRILYIKFLQHIKGVIKKLTKTDHIQK